MHSFLLDSLNYIDIRNKPSHESPLKELRTALCRLENSIPDYEELLKKQQYFVTFLPTLAGLSEKKFMKKINFIFEEECRLRSGYVECNSGTVFYFSCLAWEYKEGSQSKFNIAKALDRESDPDEIKLKIAKRKDIIHQTKQILSVLESIEEKAQGLNLYKDARSIWGQICSIAGEDALVEAGLRW